MFQRIELDVMEQALKYRISRTDLMNVDLNIVTDHIGVATIQMIKRIATEQLEEVTVTAVARVKVPTSWWQHFKQDKMPAWFVKKFPVKYTVTEQVDTATVDVKAFYDKISIPEHQHRVVIVKKDEDSLSRSFESYWHSI
jgi:hypothetical protein